VESSAYPLHDNVEERHWWFVARRRIVAHVLSSLHLPKSARLLEFGSGTGGNLPMLAGFGPVVAVEPEPTARELARRKAPDCRHVASLDDLTSDDSFDAVLALDVLEHLADPAAVLRTLRPRLRPGGRVVVTVPAHPWLFGAHDEYLHHHRRYTRRLLAQHLVDGGLTIDALSPMNAVSLVPAAAARVVELGRSLGKRDPAKSRGMSIPPRPLNELLTEAFAAERFVLPRGRLPFGLSLLAIARLANGARACA
jgi:SAM-dependent methyltransferase